MSRKVLITGFGVITAVGRNGPENLDSLLRGTCGYGELSVLETAHRDSIYCCEIKLADKELCGLASAPQGAGFTRTTLLGLIAAKEAIAASGLTGAELGESGIVSATAGGGIREFETYFRQLRDGQVADEFRAYLDTVDQGEHTERLAERLKIRRYRATVSTACSSGANAIILGARLVRNGLLDRVICGGSEALSKMAINGFNSLLILDRELCKPFDGGRKGLNLGEGAAYLVLESEEAVARSGRKAIAELRGYANVNDAFHQTASSPTGAGALNAMKMALARAGLDAADIDYVNAHGTGTENNDLSEGLAIQALFGSRVPPFSSTKPHTGHMLAAAGSVEAAYCLMALQNDVIFPNLNFHQPMSELSIRPTVELRRGTSVRNVLSNSLGFGGSATSLLFSGCR